MFPNQWYEKRDLQIHLNNKVLGIETGRKELLLEDRLRVSYDKLLLANGARSFVPPIEEVKKPGVFSLRSVEDALTIKGYAVNAKKAIIFGGGLLGLEFAASLRRLGRQVEVVEVSPRLLPRQLDQDGATFLKGRIENLGIKIALNVRTVKILGEKMVSGVLLEDGREISGDLVLISAGVRSNTSLAAEAGIKVDRGIVVDRHMQTSVDGVYAAGDVAEFEGKVYGIIPAALEQADVAAKNMLEKEKYDYEGTISSNTLRIAGIDLASMGEVNPEGAEYEEVKKIDREKGIYKKVVLRGGKIIGAIILGEKKDVTPIKKLMDREIDITVYRDLLLEDNFDYGKIFSQ
jgi:nitrite reductase (NADH) large subunit